MNARHDNADGPEDIDKAFAEIVAELERDTPLPQWPEGHDQVRDIDPAASGGPQTATSDEPNTATNAADPGPYGPTVSDPTDESDGPRDWVPPAEDIEDEGHFEPPEPPPVPTPKAGTVGGVALILVGVVLLLVPGLAGWIGTLALPAGLVCISAGIGWLLFRMRQSPPDSGWDDGAQL